MKTIPVQERKMKKKKFQSKYFCRNEKNTIVAQEQVQNSENDENFFILAK
jgi:hypothetical protein